MNFLISFPRSGQGLNKRLLQDVYRHHGWDFSYCVYYLCCKETPCQKGAEFQKHHDFDLSLTVGHEDKHVVLYRRDMIVQLEAFFRWIRRNDNIVFDYTDQSVLDELVAFIRMKRGYYEGFLDKWVRRENTVAIDYHDYVRDPADAVLKMLEVFRPDHGVTRSQIQGVIDSREEKVGFKNQLSDETRERIETALAARHEPRRGSVLQRWLGSRPKRAA